jgi:hypothetical protein
LAHDLFEIADMGSAHDVDYLIFYGELLFHVHLLKYGVSC